MIDQFLGDRDVISVPVVAPVMGVATKEIRVAEDAVDGVPPQAYRAADHAFDGVAWAPGRDELHEALAAASPHIRIHELDGLLHDLKVRATAIPLLGEKSNHARAAVDEVIQLLTERKAALEDHERRVGRGVPGA